MKRSLLALSLLAGACAEPPLGSMSHADLSVPSCSDVDLSGLDVTVAEVGAELVVSAGGTPICVGSAVEIETALGRDDDGGDYGTPLPAVNGEDDDGDKHPDELPGTPLPAVR